MCAALYELLWSDPGLMRVGRSGQEQSGVDILGHNGTHRIGIQCKHYVRTKFTFNTVAIDVKKADEANVEIQHLLFATTAPSNAKVVKAVADLSDQRRSAGKFTVSVAFWGDLCERIRRFPEVGRQYIPDFPGNTLLSIADSSAQTLTVANRLEQRHEDLVDRIKDTVATSLLNAGLASPSARGDEADSGVVLSLDLIREWMREGKTDEAQRRLDNLGDPSSFRDAYSKFRWYTSTAALAALQGNVDAAAAAFVYAFQYASDDPKAHVNRAHAYYLRGKYETADTLCSESLVRFPDCASLWGVALHARHALGLSTADLPIPESVLSTADFLFSKARLLAKQGDSRQAVATLERCIDIEPANLDAKRALLAEALTWANDRISALMANVAVDRRHSLMAALDHFEPLERTLPSMQSDLISRELSTNAVSSLLILGKEPRARSLSRQMLARHPDLEQLLRTHALELADTSQIVELKALTSQRLNELPGSVLAVLAEVSAHHGDIGWNTQVLEVAERRAPTDENLSRLKPMAFLAMWVSGDRSRALLAVQAYRMLHRAERLAATLEMRFLKGMGNLRGAIAVARSCRDSVLGEPASIDTLYAADMLSELGLSGDAVELYEQLVQAPGDDVLTWKLLDCLVKADQRSKALQLVNALPASVRALSSFRRIEINLLGRMGDLPRMRPLIEQELALDPSSPECLVALADLLFRAGDRPALARLVSGDIRMSGATPQQERTLARLQVHCGFADLALQRMFRVFRSHPTSSEIAGHFLELLVTVRDLPGPQSPSEVAPSTAVQLSDGANTYWIAIDDPACPPAETWPEVVQAGSDVANKLLTLHVGDTTIIHRGVSASPVHVVCIETILAFAIRKAQDIVASSASQAGPLLSVSTVGRGGQFDFDLLARSARWRAAYVRKCFDLYAKHHVPACQIAALLGSDPIKILLDWPYKLTSLFVGQGSAEERSNSSTLLKGGSRFVVDLLTLAEIVSLRVGPAVVAVTGRPLLAQTQFQYLLQLGEMASSAIDDKSAMLSEHNGRIRLEMVPAAYRSRRSRFLRAMIDFVSQHCDIVPTVGPPSVTDAHRMLGQHLDRGTMDSLYLCLEHRAVLLSDDGGLRTAAVDAGVCDSVALQSVLMESLSTHAMTHPEYVRAIEAKLHANHSFVTFNAADLWEMAASEPDRISRSALAAIQSFSEPTLQFESGLKVGGEFLRLAMNRLPPATVGRYTNLLVIALAGSRPEFARLVLRVFARILSDHRFGRNGRRLAPYVRRLFVPGLLRRRPGH